MYVFIFVVNKVDHKVLAKTMGNTKHRKGPQRSSETPQRTPETSQKGPQRSSETPQDTGDCKHRQCSARNVNSQINTVAHGGKKLYVASVFLYSPSTALSQSAVAYVIAAPIRPIFFHRAVALLMLSKYYDVCLNYAHCRNVVRVSFIPGCEQP